MHANLIMNITVLHKLCLLKINNKNKIKIIGGGLPLLPFLITIHYISKKLKQQIEKIGGKVILLD